MRMGRAGGLLVDGTAEGHLRIGALEDAGDAGAPLNLSFCVRDKLDAEGQADLHDIGRNNTQFHSLVVCMVLNSLAVLLVLYKNM